MRPSLFARREERGSILVLSTVGVVVAIISAALAVDLGRLAQAKRFDQKVADMAALDASRDLANACARAKQSVQRNNFDPAGLDCLDPAYNPTKDVVIGRLVNGTFTPDPTGDRVKVRVTSPFKAAFPFVSGPEAVSVKAVAGVREDAGFSIGSSVARVTAGFKSPVLNRTLERLLGGSTGSLTLDAAGYQGLASGSLTLGEIRSQMGFATINELLTADLEVRDFLDAMAVVLQGDTVLAARINQIRDTTSNSQTFKLGDIIYVDQGVGDKAASGKVNVLQMIVAAAEVANKTNFAAGCIDVPNALDNAPVTGVGRVGTDLCIKVTEGPKIYVGPVGGSRSTSQVEVTFDATIDVPITLPLPLGNLLKAVGSLPVKITAGGATGTLTDVRCGSEANPGITVTVDTHAAQTSVNGVVDLKVAATPLVVAAAGVNVTGSATGVEQADTVLSFLHPAEFSPPAPSKTTPSSPVSIATNLTASGSGNITVTVPPLISVSLPLSVVNQAVLNASQPLLNEISLRARGQEMASLGAAVAIADVAALAEFFNLSACGNPALVG